MNKKAQIVIILLVIAFFVIGGTLAYNYLQNDFQPENISTKSVNDTNTAPDFTVLDWDGKSVSLSNNFGKPIIINFWSTWCGPCQNEMPHFETMFKEYGNEVIFMIVNLTDGVSETVNSVKEFISENNFTFPVYFDTENNGAEAYGIYNIPRTICIDKNGIIIADYTGSLSEEKLLSVIDKLK